MKADNNEDKPAVNEEQQPNNIHAKPESEKANPLKPNEDKIIEDFEIYKQSEKVIRNSSSHSNSLLNRLNPSRLDDVLSHKAAKSMRDYKQELTLLKDPQANGQFVAYCIVNKQSNSGMFSHERLLLLDSRTKTIKYFSKIPQLPLRSFEEINEQSKQQIKMGNAKKFGISLLKSGIGEVQIWWIQSGKTKKWKIKMGNNQLAREFCMLVENVRNDKHRQKTESIPKQSARVNNRQTNFIAQLSILDGKKSSNQGSLNHSFISKMEPKKQEIDSTEIVANQRILETNPQMEVEMLSPFNNKDEQKQFQIQLPSTIVKAENSERKATSNADNQLLQVPFPHSSNKQSTKSIAIEEIIKNAEDHHQQQHPSSEILHNQPIKTTDKGPIQTVQNQQRIEVNPRLSEIDRMLKNRRMLEAAEESIATIKNFNREQEQLGTSKLLVKNIHRKSTNKDEFQFKQPPPTPQSHYYKSEKPQRLNAFRQNLLEERRMTELPSNREKQRKTYILNQQSHPRQQKSRSNSKNKDNSKSALLVERQWLLKWINAKDMPQMAEIYCKFMEHCKKRVEKLAEGIESWHLFHKKAEQYIIKEQNIEYTYQMLNMSENDEMSVLLEEEALRKMEQLNYIWKTINCIACKGVRFTVPLACLVKFKGLKVYCQVQLASDSLRIEEIHSPDNYINHIKVLEQALKKSLKSCSLFLVTSNQAKCIYIHQADIMPILSIQKGYMLSHSFIQHQIQESKQLDQAFIYKHLDEVSIPPFIDQLTTSRPLTTLDFEAMLERHHLNCSLLPLIYYQSLRLSKEATKYIVSQVCASFLQIQVRQRVHGYLMKRQSNKSLNRQIYHIITKVLRWKDQESRLGQRMNKYIGINIDEMENCIIDEYIIASLLIKLSLNCKIRLPFELETLEEPSFNFWREFEFEEDSIALTFTPQVTAYDHRFFNHQYTQFQSLISALPQTTSHAHFQLLKQTLTNNHNIHHSQSHQYQVLPPLLQSKIDQYEKYCINFHDNSFIREVTAEGKSAQNSYYFGREGFQFNLLSIKRYIKLKKYSEGQHLLQSQLIRAWIWCKNEPYLLISLYDLYSMLNVERHWHTAISCCLRSLRLCIQFYEKGVVPVRMLMEKTFKAAEMHCIFNELQQALNLYHASSEILQKVMEEKDYNQTIGKYLCILSISVQILMNGGRVLESVEEIRSNLGRCNKWKQLNHLPYQLMAKIYCEEFQNYLLLMRCYELMGKTVELLQTIEECSIKFIENFISVMAENKQQLDITHIPDYRFREVIKSIWQALLLNSAAKKVTYHQYFSKTYSALTLISIPSIRDILLAIKKDCQDKLPCDFRVAITSISQLIYTALPSSKLERLCASNMQSFLMERCINCLTALSSPSFLETENQQQEDENSKQLQFLSCLISVMGYEFSLGTIQAVWEGSDYLY